MSFSCKDISKLKTGWHHRPTKALQDETSSTGQTFMAVIQYLEKCRPNIYTGENLAAIATSPDLMMDAEQAFQNIGYVCRARVISSDDYTSPQKRQRTFFLAFEIWNSGADPQDARQTLDRIFNLMEKMKRPSKPLGDFLLQGEDEYLVAQRETIMSNKSAKQNDNTWCDPYAAILRGQGITLSQCIPSGEQRNSSWYPCLCERERVVLGYHMLLKGQVTCCNLSQRLTQASTSITDDVITLLPGQRLWLANLAPPHEPRFLLGREALAIQGWPIEDLHDMQGWDYLMTELAGNAISGQIWMAILVAMLACTPATMFMRNDSGSAPTAAEQDQLLDLVSDIASMD